MSEIDTKVEELSERKYEGYWAKKSIGDKIVGAISLALGAYSAARGGGPNMAFQIISKAQDEEFKSYQDVTANKIKAISQSRLSAEAKRKLIQEQVLGLQAKKESDIKIVQNKIANLSNKFADKANKATLEGLQAQLDQKLAQTRLQFEQALGTTINKTVKETRGTQVNPEMRKEAVALAKEFRSHPEIKAADKVFTSYGKIKAMAEDADNFKTGASDMSMIFAYMKMLDPGSTVREGEFATAENSGGLSEKLTNYYNKAIEGKFLTPKQRQEFLQAAGKLNIVHIDRREEVATEFRDTAKRFGHPNPHLITGTGRVAPKEVDPNTYPLTVSKDGKVAVVNNTTEYKEANKEGWK